MFEKHNDIMLIKDDPCICKWVKETDRLDHDIWLMERVYDRLTGFKGCIDVGAYIGDHTEAYAQWFDHVWAFEPNPEAFECLEWNMRNHANVSTFPYALGDGHTNGTLVADRNAGASYIEPGEGPIKFVDLPIRDDISYIKIDVEGMEPDVLAALEGIIDTNHPQMLIEQRQCDGNEEEVVDWLIEHGYTFSPIQGEYGEQYDLWCEYGD